MLESAPKEMWELLAVGKFGWSINITNSLQLSWSISFPVLSLIVSLKLFSTVHLEYNFFVTSPPWKQTKSSEMKSWYLAEVCYPILNNSDNKHSELYWRQTQYYNSLYIVFTHLQFYVKYSFIHSLELVFFPQRDKDPISAGGEMFLLRAKGEGTLR